MPFAIHPDALVCIAGRTLLSRLCTHLYTSSDKAKTAIKQAGGPKKWAERVGFVIDTSGTTTFVHLASRPVTKTAPPSSKAPQEKPRSEAEPPRIMDLLRRGSGSTPTPTLLVRSIISEALLASLNGEMRIDQLRDLLTTHPQRLDVIEVMRKHGGKTSGFGESPVATFLLKQNCFTVESTNFGLFRAKVRLANDQAAGQAVGTATCPTLQPTSSPPQSHTSPQPPCLAACGTSWRLAGDIPEWKDAPSSANDATAATNVRSSEGSSSTTSSAFRRPPPPPSASGVRRAPPPPPPPPPRETKTPQTVLANTSSAIARADTKLVGDASWSQHPPTLSIVDDLAGGRWILASATKRSASGVGNADVSHAPLALYAPSASGKRVYSSSELLCFRPACTEPCPPSLAGRYDSATTADFKQPQPLCAERPDSLPGMDVGFPQHATGKAAAAALARAEQTHPTFVRLDVVFATRAELLAGDEVALLVSTLWAICPTACSFAFPEDTLRHVLDVCTTEQRLLVVITPPEHEGEIAKAVGKYKCCTLSARTVAITGCKPPPAPPMERLIEDASSSEAASCSMGALPSVTPTSTALAPPSSVLAPHSIVHALLSTVHAKSVQQPQQYSPQLAAQAAHATAYSGHFDLNSSDDSGLDEDEDEDMHIQGTSMPSQTGGAGAPPSPDGELQTPSPATRQEESMMVEARAWPKEEAVRTTEVLVEAPVDASRSGRVEEPTEEEGSVEQAIEAGRNLWLAQRLPDPALHGSAWHCYERGSADGYEQGHADGYEQGHADVERDIYANASAAVPMLQEELEQERGREVDALIAVRLPPSADCPSVLWPSPPTVYWPLRSANIYYHPLRLVAGVA